jgi:predicted methyltransferase
MPTCEMRGVQRVVCGLKAKSLGTFSAAALMRFAATAAAFSGMTMLPLGVQEQSALVQIGQFLRQQRYRFVAVTPCTHARLHEKKRKPVSRDLRDVFGWNLPFQAELLSSGLISLLEKAGCLLQDGALLKSAIRFATLDDFLFAHSGYPTLDADSVFFGPDTYRFANLIKQTLANAQCRSGARLIDIGTGSGVGGLICASLTGIAKRVLTDISPVALSFAQSNVELAGIGDCQIACGDLFANVDGEFDIIVSNPPYMKDASGRVYRDGGDNYGAQLSERILNESLPRLARGGRLILYTGVAVVDGVDVFQPAIESALGQLGWPYRYQEIDPDVFGEEIAQPGYSAVERLAAVGLIVTRPH